MDNLDNNTTPSNRVYKTAGLTINLDSRHVFYGDDRLPIKGLTYRLLEVLLLADQQTVSHSDLANKVWKTTYVSDETVAQRISLLRKALGLIDENLIENVRGEGYRWVASINLDLDENKKSTSIGAIYSIKRAGLLTVLIATLLPLLLIIGIILDHREGIKVDGEDNFQKSELPPMIEKAYGLANQNNSASNSIAIDLFNEFLRENPNSVDARLGLAVANIERVVKFNGNELFLDFAAEEIEFLSGTDIAPWKLSRLKAYYFDARGNIDEAIFHYEQALNSNGKLITQVAASLAYLYVRKGRLYEALQLNLTAFDYKNGYTILQISEILYLTGLLEQSKKWVEIAYKYAPNDAFVAVHYSRVAYALGDKPNAYNAIARLEQFHAETANSFVELATLSMKDGDWLAAQKALRKANELEPDSLYVKSLQYWLSRKGYTDEQVNRPSTESSSPVWPNWYVAKSIVEVADGDISAARKSIGLAVSSGYLDVEYLHSLPVFAFILKEPGLDTLLRKMAHSVTTERAKISSITLPDLTESEQAE
ncbi:winged helix-turn-helix domain-containing protein [Rheinheimera baltica]|uniref:winged helix-turn-helix domain-containing protein n=1 Tax=Rheinheimera baltica TaxID=67576 RepID=UPI000405B744|nr:winged helix-turn-helix domain-containing protein [Rheinheimera baltica]